MRVRCPHCDISVKVDGEASFADITCQSCLSSFSLVDDEETRDSQEMEPRQLGHFQLTKPLGTGGFGTVWKANDLELDRAVAIKIPRKGRLTPMEAEQFLREARAAAQLTHPNIVAVHEVGREDDTVYIVADYIEGVSLADLLTGRHLTSRESAELCKTICDALHHAHTMGVIHRDLKPGNILIDRDEHPHIMDFGLAKRQSTDVTMTADGKVMGTPAYMPPEQARGEGQSVDGRSDLYSVGVILFEFLTGDRPFRGNLRMLLHQVINEEAPSPRKLNSNVPRDLETICLKCLEKDPGKRYQTALELHDEFNRFLAGEPIVARPVGRLEQAWRWAKRKPVIAGLSSALVLLLVVTAIVATFAATHFQSLAETARTAADKAVVSLNNEEKARASEEVARRAAETTLTDMFTAFGQVAGETDKPAQAALWYANAARQARNDPKREQLNRIRFREGIKALPQPETVLSHSGANLAEVQFHPGGEHLFVRTNFDHGMLWDLQSSRKIETPFSDEATVAFQWIGDGKLFGVAFVETNHVDVYQLSPLKKIQTLKHSEPVSLLAASRDGKLLAAGGRTIRVFSTETWLPVAELDHPEKVQGISFNHGGDQIVSACADNQARVFEIDGIDSNNHPLIHTFPHDAHAEEALKVIVPAFTNQDRTLVTFPEKDVVALNDVESGNEQSRFEDMNRIFDMVLSPDDQHFAICRLKQVDLFNAEVGERVGKPMISTNFDYSAVFDLSGEHLMSVNADRKARIWSMPACELVTEIAHQDEVVIAGVSPTSGQFATAQMDGLLRIWNWDPNETEINELPIEPKQVFVKLSSDGRYLYPSGWDTERVQNSLQLFDISSGAPIGPSIKLAGLFNGAALSPQLDRLITLCSSPENNRQKLLTTEQLQTQSGQIQCWSWPNGKAVFPALETATEPIAADISPDGQLAAVACGDGSIKLIELRSGEIQAEMEHGAGAAVRFLIHDRIRFTPDGKRLVTWGFDSNAKVWSVPKGELLYSVHHENAYFCYHAVLSDDAKYLATTSSSPPMAVLITDFETGKLIKSLPHPDWVYTAEFGRGDYSGKYLLTSCRDGMARLWDWENELLVCPGFAHKDSVIDATMTADGKFVVTGSRDTTIRIWEPATGKPISKQFEFPGKVLQVVLTNDDSELVVAGQKHTLHVVDVDSMLAAPDLKVSTAELQTIGELLSGQRVHKSGGVVNLTTKDWLDRWSQLHPVNE